MIRPLVLLAFAAGAFASGIPPGRHSSLLKRDDGTSQSASASLAPSASPSPSLATSVSASGSPSPSGGTKALSLATSLLNSSPSNCTQAGGGCRILGYTLPSCSEDECACQDDITLAAMVCAQCIADSGAVEVYNSYLTECQDEGYAHPNQTVSVSVQVATSQSPSPSAGASESVLPSVTPSGSGDLQFSDITIGSSDLSNLSTASSTAVVGGLFISTSSAAGASTSPSISHGGMTGLVALQEATTSILGSAIPATASASTPISGISASASTSASSLSDSSATSVLSSAVPSSSANISLSSSVLSLNAAIAYFATPIDSTCTDDCSTWKALSNTCTQDLCICTNSGVSSASACSQCLGTTTHGTTYQEQIQNYNAFMANCSIEVSDLSPSGSTVLSGYEIVADATNTSSLLSATSSISPLNSENATKVAAEAVVTVTNSQADHSLNLPSVRPDMLLGIIVGVALGALML